jgi:two-component system response regulator AtoC
MRLLILDPDEQFHRTVCPALDEAGHEVLLRRDPEAALVEAQATGVEGLILDLEASESGVLNILRRYRAAGGSGIVVVLGGALTAPLATQALREGADGFVRNPALPEEVLLALRHAEERERRRQDVARLRATLMSRAAVTSARTGVSSASRERKSRCVSVRKTARRLASRLDQRAQTSAPVPSAGFPRKRRSR